MGKGFILAIDQGTTGTTVQIIDQNGDVVSRGYHEFTQIYPKPGWVEHDPMEIWGVTLGTVKQAMLQADIKGEEIKGIGIANQRETTVVWERATGKPVTNAIVWQCRRTAPICEELKRSGMENQVHSKTGLLIDAYFSGTKLAWILENIPNCRARAENGELLFGTIDSWLIWKLTGGKVHVTDYSNASRTMLYNIHELAWDNDMLRTLNIPAVMLPKVVSSSQVYGYTDASELGVSVPVAGVAGDQQAALFGQTCFQPGTAKNTYGTGCFLLLNTGKKPIDSKQGLLTTIAWGIGDEVLYALEGSVFVAGASVQWLRDEMRLVDRAADSELLATAVTDNGGVYLVPAFTGLGAPYWDMYARGTLVGMTRGTSREHVARATLESIAYQTYDVLNAMSKDSGVKLASLKVDGGAVQNNFLMQFQADILGVPVERPVASESTVLGAAFLAGLAVDYWKDMNQLQEIRKIQRVFEPVMPAGERRANLLEWKRAVACALSYSRSRELNFEID
ncbi:MAG: glycerol kinase GlpK [Solirubrobacterales bacterium]